MRKILLIIGIFSEHVIHCIVAAKIKLNDHASHENLQYIGRSIRGNGAVKSDKCIKISCETIDGELKVESRIFKLITTHFNLSSLDITITSKRDVPVVIVTTTDASEVIRKIKCNKRIIIEKPRYPFVYRETKIQPKDAQTADSASIQSDRRTQSSCDLDESIARDIENLATKDQGTQTDPTPDTAILLALLDVQRRLSALENQSLYTYNPFGLPTLQRR